MENADHFWHNRREEAIIIAISKQGHRAPWTSESASLPLRNFAMGNQSRVMPQADSRMARQNRSISKGPNIRLLASIVLLSCSVPTLAADKPNIVVFLTDDQGWLDTTFNGSQDVRTPHMQALADSGMTFTRAFVASPSCAPSRAALLTGLTPAHNGAEPNHSKPRADIKKLPAYLQDLGYEVVAFGKVSHYRQAKDYGFDHFAHDTFFDQKCIPAAVDFLKNRKSDKPLCLFVGTNWPHVPWPQESSYRPRETTLPPTFIDTPNTHKTRANYYQAVTNADDNLGDVHAAALDAAGDKTIFLFTSDHGAQWPFGKWNLYDSGIRVPFVVVWPGVTKPGSASDAMISWIDILPTLVEMAGGDAPKDIDGRSIVGVIRGKADKHRDRIFTTHSADGNKNIYPSRSVRTKEFKYILNLHPEFKYTTHIDLVPVRPGIDYWNSWEAAARKNPKDAAILQRYHERPKEELYDLRKDPFEQHDLATNPAHADRLRQMRGELEAWMKDQGDERKVFGTPILLKEE